MTLPSSGIIRAAQAAMGQLADRNTPFITNEWYVVALASELGRSLLKRRLLDRSLVMFRTQAGVAVALEDRCAHRSFPLSSGTLDGDTVVCGYHGLRFDAHGDCIQIPSQKDCPKGIGVRSYPLVERGPYVWGWFGDQPAAHNAIPDTAWLQSPDWVSSEGYLHLPGNYVSLHENLLDLTHLTYIHAKSFGTPDYALAPYETFLENGRFRITRRVVPTQLPPVWAQPTGIRHDQAARIATSEFVSPGLHVVEVLFYDSSAPAEGRPEYRIRTCHAPTPESHGSTHYFIVHSRDFVLQHQQTTLDMHTRLFTAFREDVEALTKLEKVLEKPADPYFEISIASDAPTLAMRRYLRKRALEERTNSEGKA
ncbi:MAG: aromatic ring-hydroxylating dioxygenase subunit alpha [Sinobacteraceae bacterium]|nr:aromatic ring-hydroxylating dioxygenase subunit alpha [Nevskiaceae bacterium]